MKCKECYNTGLTAPNNDYCECIHGKAVECETEYDLDKEQEEYNIFVSDHIQEDPDARFIYVGEEIFYDWVLEHGTKVV